MSNIIKFPTVNPIDIIEVRKTMDAQDAKRNEFNLDERDLESSVLYCSDCGQAEFYYTQDNFLVCTHCKGHVDVLEVFKE